MLKCYVYIYIQIVQQRTKGIYPSDLANMQINCTYNYFS